MKVRYKPDVEHYEAEKKRHDAIRAEHAARVAEWEASEAEAKRAHDAFVEAVERDHAERVEEYERQAEKHKRDVEKRRGRRLLRHIKREVPQPSPPPEKPQIEKPEPTPKPDAPTLELAEPPVYEAYRVDPDNPGAVQHVNGREGALRATSGSWVVSGGDGFCVIVRHEDYERDWEKK